MGNLLNKENQMQRIIRKTGRKLCECRCNQCKQQCHTPCLGTPQDIERLIEAGYADQLDITFWCAGMVMGIVNFPVPMVQAITKGEFCIFYHNGLCDLHDKGLKPTEGKLSHHSIRIDNFKSSKSIAWNVAKEWLDKDNLEVIEKIFNRIMNNEAKP